VTWGALFILLVSGAALGVQLSTTDEYIQAYAGIAVLAAIALPAIGSAVCALVALAQEVALAVAVRRGRVRRIPLAVVSESIGEDSNGGAQFWRGDR